MCDFTKKFLMRVLLIRQLECTTTIDCDTVPVILSRWKVQDLDQEPANLQVQVLRDWESRNRQVYLSLQISLTFLGLSIRLQQQVNLLRKWLFWHHFLIHARPVVNFMPDLWLTFRTDISVLCKQSTISYNIAIEWFTWPYTSTQANKV